jgi:hypothetical protein
MKVAASPAMTFMIIGYPGGITATGFYPFPHRQGGRIACLTSVYVPAHAAERRLQADSIPATSTSGR